MRACIHILAKWFDRMQRHYKLTSRFFRCSMSLLHWVVLPHLSTPSNTMKAPAVGDANDSESLSCNRRMLCARSVLHSLTVAPKETRTPWPTWPTKCADLSCHSNACTRGPWVAAWSLLGPPGLQQLLMYLWGGSSPPSK
jgi:hypothetical protein